MPEIPVPFNDRLISYTAVGGETTYATDFPIQDDGDLTVTLTRAGITSTLTITTDYSVSIADATQIATITLVSAAVAADIYRLVGNTVIERVTDFQQRGGWQADQINEEFDRLTMIQQEMQRDFEAALVGDLTLPLDVESGGTGYASLAWARGHIAGAKLSNNVADATNDIDIAAGVGVASDQSAFIVLPAALTKQLDAVWAVGTNAGMRASGAAIADTTYHIFLIRRPDTGVVDIAADTSATGANIAANTNVAYTQKRRIGSIIRASAAIVTFRQFGDTFKRTAALDRNDTAAVASALLTVSVPLGIVVQPIFRFTMAGLAGVTCSAAMGDGAESSATIVVNQIFCSAADGSETNEEILPPVFYTNTSAQIYFSQTNTAGTPATSQLRTIGWVDRRGKDD